MLFETPTLDAQEEWVLQNVTDLRARLSSAVREPRRWLGVLRQVSLARAIQGSNSIEGYNVSLDDAVAAADDEQPLDARQDAWLAVLGYRDAMTYVLQLADDPRATLDESLLRSLHFMMLKHDLGKSPGRWRPGTIYVRQGETGEIVYEAPDAGEVPGLMAELMGRANAAGPEPAMIRAAMAHLNLVMIHPFRDGNGRHPVAPLLQRRGVPRAEHRGLLRRAWARRGRQLAPRPRRQAVDPVHAHRPLPPGADAPATHRGKRATVERS
jgi:Fic family protein